MSKTDQYKKGDNVIIAKKEQEELCPVRCVKAYLGLILNSGLYLIFEQCFTVQKGLSIEKIKVRSASVMQSY